MRCHGSAGQMGLSGTGTESLLLLTGQLHGWPPPTGEGGKNSKGVDMDDLTSSCLANIQSYRKSACDPAACQQEVLESSLCVVST